MKSPQPSILFNAFRSATRIGLILSALFLLLASGCADVRITRTSDGAQVEFARMVQEIQDAKIILVGETHNNKEHHRLQLQVIQALHDRGKRLAIGAEMFTASSQDQLDLWNAGIMDRLSFQWLYEDHWSEPWPLYRDLFLYAHDNSIPVFGLNYNRELVRKISSQGVEALTSKEKAQLPSDLKCDPNSSYTSFLKRIYQGHPQKSRSFEDFCSVQLLWNKGMGRRIAEYLEKHPEQTVVALVGTLHAVRDAIPAQIPHVDLRVLAPELPGQVSRQDDDFEFR